MTPAGSEPLGVFDAVLFDFDGTLANSYESMMTAYRIFAEEYGVGLDKVRSFTGMPSESLARALLPAEQAVAGGERIDELESSNTDGVVALPGALAALEAIPATRWAIATSCTHRLITARLRAAGLPTPSVLVPCDSVANGKPAPDSFLLAAKLLGFEPSRCLVLEDAPAGVAGARAAGCAVGGVLTGHTAEELGADWHVETLADLRFDVADDGVSVFRVRG